MTSRIQFDNANLHYSSIGFRDRSLKATLTRLLRRTDIHSKVVDIHALKNISMDWRSGDRIGLIGHNGAGKSTLLKAIAGLYPLSSGQRRVIGTVRSLFDLSLGFEPHATGRANILYRGLLLGMTPKAMRSLEAEIIAFADLGEFIDYPLLTYSAGMQVRLAFAISTMIGGHILLLDEVIGAGDAAFMARAKQRILQLVDAAEILVLASHDPNALRSLCNRGMVLSHGEIVFEGDIASALDFYTTTPPGRR